MSWLKWASGNHHGKERETKKSDGTVKKEFLLGNKGESYSSHVSVTQKLDGSKSAHAGPHKDKK